MSNSTKRPRPFVCEFEQDNLDWDPEAREQFTFVDEESVRSGDSYAIVRPGMERWPLGFVSGVYKPTSHRHTVDMILEAAGDEVEPYGRPMMSGHGYRVIHQFGVKQQDLFELHGLPVTSRLTIVHDHTGLHALKARMVVYVGENALGSIVGARAIHVSENPEKWRVEVEQMIDRSKAAQEALTDLLEAAQDFVLTEAHKSHLEALKVKPSGKEGWQRTLLESMIKYHQSSTASQITFGVWERRLSDDAIVAMVKVMGQAKYGVALDLALGGRRYGGSYTDAARRGESKPAKAV